MIGIKRINIYYKVKENIFYVEEINWIKDGDIFICNNRSRKYNGGGLKDSYLIIILLIIEDRGIYKCMVKNVVGIEYWEVKIGIVFLFYWYLICLVDLIENFKL